MNAIRSFILITLVCAGLAARAAPGDPDLNYKDLGEISSIGLRAIEKAMPLFREQMLPWSEYRVGVAEGENDYAVEFWPPGESRAPIAMIIYLDKKTLEVIRWNYLRH
jgi:hypothetical protein